MTWQAAVLLAGGGVAIGVAIGVVGCGAWLLYVWTDGFKNLGPR